MLRNSRSPKSLYHPMWGNAVVSPSVSLKLWHKTSRKDVNRVSAGDSLLSLPQSSVNRLRQSANFRGPQGGWMQKIIFPFQWSYIFLIQWVMEGWVIADEQTPAIFLVFYLSRLKPVWMPSVSLIRMTNDILVLWSYDLTVWIFGCVDICVTVMSAKEPSDVICVVLLS